MSSLNITCETCHALYLSQSSHFNGSLDTGNPSFPIVNISVSGIAGAWTNTAGRGAGSCSSVACHGSAVLEWYGTGGLPDCSVCHTGALDPVTLNGSGTSGKHTSHVASHNIPCIRCHANYPDNPGHMLVTYSGTTPTSLVSFDSTNPSGAWVSDTGSQTGSCASLVCHAGQTVDWYGTAGWTIPACNSCHSATIGARRQVLGAGGDFNRESHHVINYASRTTSIVTDPDCLVCHNMDHHMSGELRLRNKDNAAQSIIYSASTPSSLEPFCLSCHDANGATTEALPFKPFSSPNTLGAGRNVAGNKIKDYWNSAYTAHKTNGLTCAGTGSPDTGCHGNNRTINMHGSSSRGLLAQNVTNPIPLTQTYNYNDYRLCFDCHANYPAVTKEVILGYRLGGNYDVAYAAPEFTLSATPYYTSGIQSLFRDRYVSGDPRPYSDIVFLPAFSYAYMPLHNFHLFGTYFDPLVNVSLPFRPNWLSAYYRNDTAQAGRITCTACHNVHGTNSSVRSTYDSLQLTSHAGAGLDFYTSLPITAAQTSVMSAYPLNCTADCHGIQGATSYWHTPSDE